MGIITDTFHGVFEFSFFSKYIFHHFLNIFLSDNPHNPSNIITNCLNNPKGPARAAPRDHSRSTGNEKLTLDKSSKYDLDSKNAILKRFLTFLTIFQAKVKQKCRAQCKSCPWNFAVFKQFVENVKL